MENQEISEQLNELADLLEIRGANPFRIRAYRNAVRTIRGLTRPLSAMVAADEELTDLPGIGTDMAAHIRELLSTGELALVGEVTQEVPRSLAVLTRIEGLGPKKVKRLWKELGVTTPDELEAGLVRGAVASLEGFGEKSAEKLVRALADFRKHQGRFRRDEAARRIRPILELLSGIPGVEQVEVAGSYRRGMETVGDIDLLATVSGSAERVMERFTAYEGTDRVERAGSTRGRIVLRNGLAVDLRIVPEESFGAALHYFTGSMEHNVEIRRLAKGAGLRVSEYGVFRVPEGVDPDELAPGEGERVGGRTEEEVFAAVGLPWIDPVLRENRGEIAAARAGELPELLTGRDIRGDLHMHTTWSDGSHSIEEMARAAAGRGYEYIAITDHSQAVTVARGLTPERLRDQWIEIDEVRARVAGLHIFSGCEVDILKDGSLDLPDSVLEELDIVLVAVHSHFELDSETQTRRICAALQHPMVDVLVHPTGRLINRREPYPVDMEAILETAKENRVAVELNASPRRLDLHDRHLFRARELGVDVIVDTDAHHVDRLAHMDSGIEQARRGWIGAKNVVNTRSLADFTAWLAR